MHKTVALLLFVSIGCSNNSSYSCTNGTDKLCQDCNYNSSMCNICTYSYPNKKSKNCQASAFSIDNCSAYDTMTTCNTCEVGYEINSRFTCSGSALLNSNSTCLAAKNGTCQYCKDSDYIPDAQGNCGNSTCPVDNCQLCDSTGTCQQCVDDYTVENGTNCLSSDFEPAYENCMSAEYPFSCDRCNKGYYVDGDGICQSLSSVVAAPSTTGVPTVKPFSINALYSRYGQIANVESGPAGQDRSAGEGQDNLAERNYVL
jgi:hypothetical protein